jgi:PPP family 3-phenylpropionic acid transporter
MSLPVPPWDLRSSGLALRLGAMFGTSFAVHGVALPYLSVWYAGRGLSIGQIATIAALTAMARMAAGPVVTFLTDRHRAYREGLIACAWATLFAWALLSQSTAFPALAASALLLAVSSAGLMPLTETLAVGGVRARGIDYGRVRAVGSITFIAAALASGFLVDWRGPPAAMALMLAGAAATVLAAHLLPRPDPTDTAVARAPVKVHDAIALARRPTMLLFLLAVGLAQGSHAVFYVFGVLHWQNLGLSNRWCGALWAIAVAAEIVLFWTAGRRLARLSALGLVGLGAASGLVRWSVMAFDPPLALLVPLQIMHAGTFAATHLGAMSFLARAVPETQSGTAQGLYALVTGGIAMAIATQIAGLAYATHAGRAYIVSALMAAGCLAALAALARRLRDEKCIAPDPRAGPLS